MTFAVVLSVLIGALLRSMVMARALSPMLPIAALGYIFGIIIGVVLYRLTYAVLLCIMMAVPTRVMV